jgi:predicted metal-binding protein
MKRADMRIPRKVDPSRDGDARRADLERYCLRAIELGAADAKIISSEQVIVEDRVRLKCMVPRCPHYGESPNCPPYAPLPEETRRIVREYHQGVFVRLMIPSDQIAGEKAMEENRMKPFRRKIHEIVSKLESEAFYDGYPLALGFAAGSCKRTFCYDVECAALSPGKGCRHPLWSRPSMESVGMNVYTMAAKAGWEIYPIGRKVSLDHLPHGSYFGLVLVH